MRKATELEKKWWRRLEFLMKRMPDSICLIANGKLQAFDSKQIQNIEMNSDVDCLTELKGIWGINESRILDKK